MCVLYFALKFRIKRYIFSPFLISFMIYIIAFAISPRFYIFPVAWRALNIRNIRPMREYLNQAISLNAAGLIVTSFVMIATEFGKKKVKYEKSIVYTMSKRIDEGIMKVVFSLTIVSWYVIVFVFAGGIPLFNGGRIFFYDTAISPVYQTLNEVMLICALYYGMRVVFNYSDRIKFVIAIMTLLFTGTRAAALTGVFAPIMIIYLYERYQKRKDGQMVTNRIKRKASYRIILTMGAVGVLGLALSFFRRGVTNVTAELVLGEFLNGNTFSDIRDGAFLLKGMNDRFPNQFLWGRTYLAGLISFIPSSLSGFRREWSYGRFTTMGLFNWPDHFGFRGGWCMEGYMNFGILGAILSAIIAGWMYGYVERMFNEIFLKNNVQHKGNEYMILHTIVNVFSFFICSASAYNIYVDIILLGGVILISKRIKLRFALRGEFGKI